MILGILGVLRGSEIKPDEPITDTFAHRSDAVVELAHVSERIDTIQETVHTLENLPTPMTDEREVVIANLLKRVEELEKKQRKGAWDYLEANEQVMRTVKQLACGGLAGAFARTMVAPIDRIKILMQTQYITLDGGPPKYTSMSQTLQTVIKEEGPAKLYRGNLTNLIRVIPYAAVQFTSYDVIKGILAFDDGTMSIPRRLAAGALAGISATSLTHPLDVCRLRLAVQPELKGTVDAIRSVWAEAGLRSMYKGWVPTCISLAPFIAINFTAFDQLKNYVYAPGEEKSHFVVLGLGAAAGIFAQTCCYPLDTVRRRMQMKGKIYNSTGDAFATILRKEGFLGFYKGMLPNAVKVVPNNALRFVAFEALRGFFGIEASDSKKR